jgi:hypothetical protein
MKRIWRRAERGAAQFMRGGLEPAQRLRVMEGALSIPHRTSDREIFRARRGKHSSSNEMR